MDKNKILIILAIIALILVIVTVSSLTINSDDKNETAFVRNNTTENISNVDESNDDNEPVESESYSEQDSDNDYKTYETGQYDSNGKPIYKTEVSGSEGESSEVTWSPSEGII